MLELYERVWYSSSQWDIGYYIIKGIITILWETLFFFGIPKMIVVITDGIISGIFKKTFHEILTHTGRFSLKG